MCQAFGQRSIRAITKLIVQMVCYLWVNGGNTYICKIGSIFFTHPLLYIFQYNLYINYFIIAFLSILLLFNEVSMLVEDAG